MDFDKPALKHVEKAVLGICVLLMLWFSVSLLSATGSESADPDALQQELKGVERRLKESDPQRDKLAAYDWQEPTKQLTTSWSAEDWSQRPLWPPPPKGVVRTKPKILVPTALRLNPYRGTILVFDRDEKGRIKRRKVAKSDQRVADAGGMAGAGADAIPGRRGPRGDVGGAGDEAAGGGRAGGAPAGVIILTDDAVAAPEGQAPEGQAPKERRGVEKRAEGERVESGEPLYRGDFRRWVLITALFPHLEQINAFERALRSRESVEYASLEVQRREQQPGGKSADWQTVTYELDYYGSLPEDEAVRHAIFRELAQPWPLLARGAWQGRDRDEVLGAAEHARKEAERAVRQDEGAQKRTRRVLVAGRPAERAAAEDETRRVQEEKEEAIRQRAAEVVKTVLVRFIDVTVQPGRTYEYRMRLWVVNPNYGLRSVEDPMIAKDELMTSEGWSKVAGPIAIPSDVHFYCRQGPVAKQAAQIEVHRWAEGDWQIQPFQLPVGDWVGHRRAVRVVDVYGEEKPEKISFRKKGHLLLDANTRELAMRVGSARLPRRVLSDVVYVDDKGDIRVRTSLSDDEDQTRRRREALALKLRNLLRARKEAEEKTTAEPEAGAGQPSAMEGATPVPDGKRGRRRRSRRGGEEMGQPRRRTR